MCVVYALLSSTWIFFSDTLVFSIFTRLEDVEHVSIIKGLLFVLASTAIIFMLIKRGMHAVEESEASYRRLIETSPDAIVLLDTTMSIRMVNPGIISLLGYKASDELLGRSFMDFVTPADAKSLRGRLQGLVESRIRTESRFDLVAKDGHIIPVESNASAILNGDGMPKSIMVILRDVTERKRAEQEIRLLAQTVASTRDCVSITDLDDKLLFVNDAFVETYGYSRAEVIGRNVEMLRAPSLSIDIKDQIRSATLKGGWYGEILNRKKDGTEFPVELWTSVVRGDGNQPVALVGVARDITRRKQAEESVKKLLHAIEQSDEVIFMTEVDGTINYVNPSFEKTYGYTKEEVIGKTPRILKSGEMPPDVYKSFWQLLLSGESVHIEMINRTKNGAVVTMDSSANPVIDQQGRVTGFIAVQNNITTRKRLEEERKRLEDQLVQSQKMESIGTLAGGIAHDFNNILAIILGHATLLDQYNGDPSKFLKSRESIIAAVERGASLVKQILMFARKSEVRFEPVVINDAVKEFIRILEETFPKDITLSTELSKEPTLVQADRIQLHQTLLNLCVNARDAMPNGGALRIITRRVHGDRLKYRFPDVQASDFVALTISDTGTGMDGATRQRIFEPFFSTKPAGKGTGLGLAMVHGIVQSHKGFIDVESTPGVGTTFHLYFPSFEQTSSHEEHVKKQVPLSSGHGETVLIVEDEDALADLVQILLESNEYNVLKASTGEDAVRLYRERHDTIDVVISDMGLPKMGGREVFRLMKTINPAVKAILASGYLEPDVKASLVADGVKEILHKPYVPVELLKVVREVLDRT